MSDYTFEKYKSDIENMLTAPEQEGGFEADLDKVLAAIEQYEDWLREQFTKGVDADSVTEELHDKPWNA